MRLLTLGLIIADQEIAKEIHLCLRDLPVRIVIEQADIADWESLLDKTERLRPDVILLDLTNIKQSPDETIRRIKRTSGAPVVVAVHTAKEPEVILGAIRSGAAEYLYPPFDPSLRQALERISAERKPEGEITTRGRVAAFFSAKGGCGATTVACHVARELQLQTNQQVLLADFDLENGIVGFLMKAKSPYTVLDAIRNFNRLDPSYWKALISNGIPGLEIISAPVTISGMQPSDTERLQPVLHFVRMQYDWVVVDLGRSLTRACLGAMEEVDECFLISTVDVPALYKCKHIVRTLVDSGYSAEHLHLVLNRVPKRTELTRDEIQQMLGLPVSFALPEDYNGLYEAYTEGKLLPPNNHLARHLTEIARHLAGVSEKKGKGLLSILRS